MKVGVSLFMQNYGDWDRYEAEERGEAQGPARVPDWNIYEEPLAEAEASMRLFAKEALPAVQKLPVPPLSVA